MTGHDPAGPLSVVLVSEHASPLAALGASTRAGRTSTSRVSPGRSPTAATRWRCSPAATTAACPTRW